MKLVMTFGSFDLIHPGHLYYLKKSKKHGDKLIVGVATDKSILEIKGKKPLYNEKERLLEVKNLNIADEVILGNDKGSVYDILEEIKPNIICLGYDQKPSNEELKKELKLRKINAEIIRISSFNPEKYKSSKLKNIN
ncbi:MAG: FAD synthase [Candidatus Nanoarchaeia archaeon]|jgi:cytidyltransferase-like protein|nr:FAD synthase [Candidatus Nanoarchaeia archaeon]|tara:strand:- start:5999 stop:6409 length:411 start_codon:yes stop_codon:yes gene_type:complete